MDLEDQSMDIAPNNATHIFNVATHTLMMDMHKFLPFPYQMLFETYACHMEWHKFYTSQVKDWPFHQTLCFVHDNFDLIVFLKRSRHDNNDECMNLENMKRSHPHMTLYRDVLFLVGVEEYDVRLNHY